MVECVVRDAEHRMLVIPYTRMGAIGSYPLQHSNHHVFLDFFLLECVCGCRCVRMCMYVCLGVGVCLGVCVREGERRGGDLKD